MSALTLTEAGIFFLVRGTPSCALHLLLADAIHSSEVGHTRDSFKKKIKQDFDNRRAIRMNRARYPLRSHAREDKTLAMLRYIVNNFDAMVDHAIQMGTMEYDDAE